MTDGPTTKAGKRAKAGKVMREFHEGKLHSGSKKGPVVTNPAQAQAIAMSESNQSRPVTEGRAQHNPKGSTAVGERHGHRRVVP